ncbi:TPA: CBS domain-containing protein [Campylobacter lari]|nr:CBS domain-containing protein [Campylobacter lari]
MKVSASVYSSTSDLKELILKLEELKVDFIHIDCNDDNDVFKDIKLIREITNIPIDLHIISEYPSRFYNDIIDNEIEFATFQYECIKEELILPPEIIAKTEIGIAIMTDTSIDIFDKFKDFANFILIMATIPGKSGGKFAVENFQKIRNFNKKYNKKIHVDGGINAEIAFILRNLGVDSVVSGSYLVNSNDIFKSLFNLKYGVTGECKVQDFMVLLEESPFLYSNNLSLKSIIKCIVMGGLGFCIILESDNRIQGIVTSGDILRYFLHQQYDFKNFEINNLINRDPFLIKSKDSVLNMVNLLKTSKKSLVFVPVVDDNNKVLGVVSFKELIKGGF